MTARSQGGFAFRTASLPNQPPSQFGLPSSALPPASYPVIVSLFAFPFSSGVSHFAAWA